MPTFRENRQKKNKFQIKLKIQKKKNFFIIKIKQKVFFNQHLNLERETRKKDKTKKKN